MINDKKVTIITVTYNRKNLLLRCMKSIALQDFDGFIEHIIVGDGCPFLLSQEKLIQLYYKNYGKGNIEAKILHRERDTEQYVWERVAKHKNIAVQLSSGNYIVNLDDDNTISFNHLSTLHLKILDGYDAVHSWRYLLNSDGTPCLLSQYPWVIGGDFPRARLLYKIQFEHGVFTNNSNVIKDTLYLNYKNQTYCTVDANEWMINKDLFINKQLKYTDSYTYTDILYGHCEDYLFGTRIKELDFKVGCTELPTLNYYLSGNSQEPIDE